MFRVGAVFPVEPVTPQITIAAMYRLYVDEVGNDDVSSLDNENERFLSLTGVIMTVRDARDFLGVRMDSLKIDLFNHDPDDPVVLHRKKILKASGPFATLQEPARRAIFDSRIMTIKQETPYRVITALLDKRAMLRKHHWRSRHPYHFLMEVLVEKFVQFLERHQAIGDIMPESRMGKKDENLQKAFIDARDRGTYYVSQDRIRRRLPSCHLKFRRKQDNIAGLQLADLLAHPSHMVIREMMGHDVALGPYCQRVKNLLLHEKYDRSEKGRILGYGVKWLP